MKAGTNLEKVLDSGRFTVTAEVGPPKGASPTVVRRRGELIRNYVDAVNVTDNQTAVVRMSSWAGCSILRTLGIDPVMQMVCRDRNRIAIQSDVLGAIGLGIGNILCLSGDHQRFGNHPSAKGVFDIDSIQLIQTLKNMRDEKKFICGEDVSGEVRIYIGAAANPFADPFEFRVARLAKKVKAGADFIQTQAVYDVSRFRKWMDMVCERGDYVAGVTVPDEIITRLEQAENTKEEGLVIPLEIIEELKEIPGVHGIHIMAVGWEDIVPEIVERAGLLPRPVL